MIVKTASEALARYQDFLDRDALVQSVWHTEKDGRELACALGVLGDEVNSAIDCPVRVMPRWLAQYVVWLFDNQDFADAKDWGGRFYAELARLNGVVPFSVVHDWQANIVCQLAIKVAKECNHDPAPHIAVQELHRRALAGDIAPKDEWVAKLRLAYADANAYANANAYSCAYAGAYAYADAYANADADAYACACTYADAYACAYAKTVTRLADGIIECMARVKGRYGLMEGRMDDKTYQCAACKGIFEYVTDGTWTEDDAVEETAMLFGLSPGPDTAIICDECFNKGRLF